MAKTSLILLILDLVVMVVNGSLAGSSPLKPEIWGLSRLVIGVLACSDERYPTPVAILQNIEGLYLGVGSNL